MPRSISKRSLAAVVALVAAVLVAPGARSATSELFISEYIEGSSNNKAIEIYNGTGAAVNLATGGYNIQMYFNGSASAGLTINLTGTVADGDVYVIAQSSASATILAQADQTNGSGWFNGDDAVVLRKGTTIIDVVGQIGFDPGTEWGTGLTSTADNTLRRKSTVTAGDTNGADAFDPSVEWLGFAVDTFGGLGCYSEAGCPLGVGAATPPNGPPSTVTLLTVTVTPGTSPASTGIAVSADLFSIGGSSTQTFFDNGTNGDVTAGDNVFSWQQSVSGTPAVKTLPFTVTDAQGRLSGARITFTIDPPLVAIHDIQGNGATSPYAGQLVKTTGVVTARRFNNGYFIQVPDADADADPNTSEGIFVFTSSAPPATAAVGNLVQVVGTVQEFAPGGEAVTTTEIASPTTTLLSSGNTLPTPVTLTTPAHDYADYEKYEGMRVQANITVVAPTGGTVDQDTATAASNGIFFAVLDGVARPFREPGIEDLATVPPCIPGPCSPSLPRFDENVERLRIASRGQINGTIIDVNTGAQISNLTGVLDYAFRTNTILVDLTSPHVVTPSPLTAAIPAPVPLADEFTVASANLERFFNDTTSDGGAADETPDSHDIYVNRLRKVSMLIRNVLQSPDILAVQEVENLATLSDIAAQVLTDGGPTYSAHLIEGFDVGGIDSGFLVKTDPQCASAPRVIVRDVIQEVPDPNTYDDPLNPGVCLEDPPGTCNQLQDRPPLFLEATVVHPLGLTYDLTVVNVHNRSLSGIDDESTTTGYRVRAKRRAQAEHLAGLIQARQATENVVVVGDFNAFQFNDGYEDSIGTILGTPTPVNEAVLTSPDLVGPPDFVNVSALEPTGEQYSFLFDGNAQELDHVLLNTSAQDVYVGLAHPRTNADFAEAPYRGDFTRPERVSDHDPVVSYFEFPKEIAVVEPDSSNVCAVQVDSPGGTAGSVVLKATVTDAEENPPCPDRICLAGPSTGTATFDVVLNPVGGGAPAIAGTVTILSCTGGEMIVQASFTDVPVNIYEVVFSVDASNPYYEGSGSSVLAVFDPSLGFASGGGNVVNPKTGNLANFGFNVKFQKRGGAQGSLLYVEHTPDGAIKAKSNSIKSLAILDNEAVIVTKNAVAKLDPLGDFAGGYSLFVRAIDNGTPGKATDQFGLQLVGPDGKVVTDLTYDPQDLRGGNVDVPHKKGR